MGRSKTTLTLVELVTRIASLGKGQIIYAELPWTPASRAVVLPATYDKSGNLIEPPPEAVSLGLVSVMAVGDAQVVIRDWINEHGPSVTDLSKCERLIEYAIYDA